MVFRFPKIGSTTVAAVNAVNEKARQVDEQFEITQKAEVVKKHVTTGLMAAWTQAQAGLAQVGSVIMFHLFLYRKTIT